MTMSCWHNPGSCTCKQQCQCLDKIKFDFSVSVGGGRGRIKRASLALMDSSVLPELTQQDAREVRQGGKIFDYVCPKTVLPSACQQSGAWARLWFSQTHPALWEKINWRAVLQQNTFPLHLVATSTWSATTRRWLLAGSKAASSFQLSPRESLLQCKDFLPLAFIFISPGSFFH